MLGQYAPPILILNGIPFIFGANICYMTSISREDNSVLQVEGSNFQGENFVMGGTSIPSLWTDLSTYHVKRTNNTTSFNINFWIIDNPQAEVFTDLLLPALEAMMRTSSLPSQFIYGTFYGVWLLVENISKKWNNQSGYLELTISCKENIYALMTDTTLNPVDKKPTVIEGAKV